MRIEKRKVGSKRNLVSSFITAFVGSGSVESVCIKFAMFDGMGDGNFDIVHFGRADRQGFGGGVQGQGVGVGHHGLSWRVPDQSSRLGRDWQCPAAGRFTPGPFPAKCRVSA